MFKGLFGWLKRATPPCCCKEESLSVSKTSNIDRSKPFTKEVDGVTLNWSGRPDLYFRWTGTCRYCAEPLVETALLIPLKGDAHWPAGYTRDANGWPLDPQGNKVEMCNDEC